MYPNQPRNNSRNSIPVNQPIMQPQNSLYAMNVNNLNGLNNLKDNVITAKQPIPQHVYTTSNNNLYVQTVTPLVSGVPYVQQQNTIVKQTNQINQVLQTQLVQYNNIIPLTNANRVVHQNYHISGQRVNTNTNLSNLLNTSDVTSLHQITQVPSINATTYHIHKNDGRIVSPPTIVNFPHTIANLNAVQQPTLSTKIAQNNVQYQAM